MLLASFSVWHIFFKFQLNQPGLALLQGFFLLYTYMKSGEKCAGAAWLLFRPALPCFH